MMKKHTCPVSLWSLHIVGVTDVNQVILQMVAQPGLDFDAVKRRIEVSIFFKEDMSDDFSQERRKASLIFADTFKDKTIFFVLENVSFSAVLRQLVSPNEDWRSHEESPVHTDTLRRSCI